MHHLGVNAEGLRILTPPEIAEKNVIKINLTCKFNSYFKVSHETHK
jgi:hypothetical protein